MQNTTFIKAITGCFIALCLGSCSKSDFYEETSDSQPTEYTFTINALSAGENGEAMSRADVNVTDKRYDEYSFEPERFSEATGNNMINSIRIMLLKGEAVVYTKLFVKDPLSSVLPNGTIDYSRLMAQFPGEYRVSDFGSFLQLYSSQPNPNDAWKKRFKLSFRFAKGRYRVMFFANTMPLFQSSFFGVLNRQPYVPDYWKIDIALKNAKTLSEIRQIQAKYRVMPFGDYRTFADYNTARGGSNVGGVGGATQITCGLPMYGQTEITPSENTYKVELYRSIAGLQIYYKDFRITKPTIHFELLNQPKLKGYPNAWVAQPVSFQSYLTPYAGWYQRSDIEMVSRDVRYEAAYDYGAWVRNKFRTEPTENWPENGLTAIYNNEVGNPAYNYAIIPEHWNDSPFERDESKATVLRVWYDKTLSGGRTARVSYDIPLYQIRPLNSGLKDYTVRGNYFYRFLLNIKEANISASVLLNNETVPRELYTTNISYE